MSDISPPPIRTADQDATTRELFRDFVVPTYGRFDLCISSGAGCRVADDCGRSYLDFGAGIAVCSIGHSHPKVTEVLTRQSQTLGHTSNLYYSELQGLLARKLVQLLGHPGKIFFCNSGAEANEALYKLARKFGNQATPPAPRHTVGEWVESYQSRGEIITFDGSFHGRTLAGISATGQRKVKTGFEPMVQGFTQVPFDDAPALLSAITPQTVAVLLEPIQGERGIWPCAPHFLKAVRGICDDHGLLLLLDEIQCGLGRTGDWCGWKTLVGDSVVPDAVSWAKGIAGGYPMGAVWIGDRPVSLKAGGEVALCDLLGPGSHGTTFGGAPLACAVALAVLEVVEQENLLENARTLGAYALEELRNLDSPQISAVRGVGLMLGIDLSEDVQLGDANRAASLAFVDLLHSRGLLSVPSGTHSIRWLPPLNVTKSEVDEAIDILRAALRDVPMGPAK